MSDQTISAEELLAALTQNDGPTKSVNSTVDDMIAEALGVSDRGERLGLDCHGEDVFDHDLVDIQLGKDAFLHGIVTHGPEEGQENEEQPIMCVGLVLFQPHRCDSYPGPYSVITGGGPGGTFLLANDGDADLITFDGEDFPRLQVRARLNTPQWALEVMRPAERF